MPRRCTSSPRIPSTPSPRAADRDAVHRCRRSLVGFDELPDFLRDNKYIRTGYRSEWPLLDAFLSVLLWHNETLNVWTHLGGFLVFSWLAVAGGQAAAVDLLKTSSTASIDQRLAVPGWPRMVFLVGAMSCLLGSTALHLLGCHSRRVRATLRLLDYSGITVMIVTSFVPAIYYSFLCHPITRFVYLCAITGLGVLSIVALIIARSNPQFRPFRVALFLALGFSGIIPSAHALWINSGHRECYAAVGLELVMAAAYAGGAGLYASRIPEKWRPGKFDFVGQSHQIFHCLVLVGAFTHYAAVSILVNWRENGSSASACATGTAL